MSPAVEAQEVLKGVGGAGVMLEPFVHQVGGHSYVLRFGEQTICKPLNPREHLFYQSLPAAMRKFTPQYRGVVSVVFEEDREGNLCLMAYPLHGERESGDDCDDAEPRSTMCKWRRAMTSTLMVETESLGKDKDKSVHTLDLSHSSSAPELQHNPWSLQCHQQQLQSMRENAEQRDQYKFILLENLTWKHSVPCVLDLKMGTRQHGDDASEEKKLLHMRKCELSTSAAIGVRLCGMQVFQPDTGQLMFMDKYLGRQLSLPDFKEALFQFFHSGRRLRLELLSPVLRRLRDMQVALESCESYRFYSSSLLIIYDGAPDRRRHRRHAEAGLSEEDEEEQDEEEEPDEEPDEDARDEDARDEAADFVFPRGSSGDDSGGVSTSGASRSDGPVDVRMIDFAHTTCRGFTGDSVIHEGGDSGYIFGLQNLISIISELQNHNTH